jgi:hypothetical protein
MATNVATLEERVNNHIAGFKAAIAGGFAWLAVLSLLLYNIRTDVKGIAVAQADAPARVVAQVLSQPQTSGAGLASNLNAASAILQSSKLGKVKPGGSALVAVSSKLSEIQDREPNLPSVWDATGAFINYRSASIARGGIPVSPTGRCLVGLGVTDRLVTTVSNCEMDLDTFPSTTAINGNYPEYQCFNCIVRYSGGPIYASALRFIDCIFRFDIHGVPSHEGIKALQKLTSDGYERDITLKLAG